MKQVDNNKKTKFLRWFIEHHFPKKVESVWLLKYISVSQKILNRLVFVSDARKYDRSILISARGTNTPSFIYRKNGVVSYSIENTYLDINTEEHIPLYMEIHFPGSHYSEEYFEVLEDDFSEVFLTNDEKMEIDLFLERSDKYYQKMKLLKQIDKTLDERDIDKFKLLTEKLKKFEF